jgi:hypothetical protein
MEILRRGVHSERSGALQLVPAPWNTSNYSFEFWGLTTTTRARATAMLWATQIASRW